VFVPVCVALGIVVLVAAVLVNYCLIMPGSSYKGKLPPLSSEQTRMEKDLHRHVHYLAVTVGERNFRQPEQLEKSAQYIKAQLENDGWHVDTQTFEFGGQSFKNLIAQRRGTTRADEIVVVGAHYDSVLDCPAANDNGTGVAALLCLAHRFRQTDSSRTLRFVAFTNEESYFGTEGMGSYQYAQSCFQKKHANKTADPVVVTWQGFCGIICQL